uniref:YqaJ viral recombinase domain-containing protein n=1 Tax=Brassica campestris TaxID=3711 RepID=M4CJ57_BRACM
MRTCSIPMFHTLIPKPSASVSPRPKFRNRSSSQPFSSTALQVLSQTSLPLVAVPPRSSLAVSSHLSPSDIPQKSEEWFALRKDKLTTSTFSTALGFWKKNRRSELWHEKVYDSESSRVVEDSAKFAMNWGVQMESAAIERYKRIMGCEVGSMGFALHSQEQFHWLGASPDGVLDVGILEVKYAEKAYDSESSRVGEDSAKFAMNWGVQMESAAIERYKRIMGCEVGSMGFALHSQEQFHWLGASPDGVLDVGILEVKCPYNKGKTETVLPWSKVPFYYMPQMQGQMEIMDREWVDLYCWTLNGSSVFRVMRDRSYWRIIYEVLREFWWENVIPARGALLLGKDDAEVKKYEPTSTHKLTGLAIAKSISLAAESKLVCREIADHVEFF